jgi:CxxC motif-containing protein (DUF1111 family)
LTNTLGNGFVEAIATATILEANGAGRIGRFGWKCQHASLQSFSADAYLNEMGVTSPLLPDENPAGDRDVVGHDPVADPEDDGEDLLAFANFMRSTKAPSRGPLNAEVGAGEEVFTRVGCATCHIASITTAPTGTQVNGGAFIVPAALGNKVIHPYSDFLMHDIGSGDGIPVLPTAEYAGTASQIRTAPLWGLRTRNRLMHDGLSFAQKKEIHRHGGQATDVRQRFVALSAADKKLLMKFLDSL